MNQETKLKTLKVGGLLAVKLLLLMGLAISVMPETVSAAAISWADAHTLKNDSDVITNGTLAYAYDWANKSQTINGVSFAGANSPTSVSTNLGLTFAAVNTSAVYRNTAPFNTLSSAYTNILIGVAYKDAVAPNSATVTLSNLVSGHAYAVQVWVCDPRGTANKENLTSAGGNSVTLTYSSTGTTAGGLGQYAIGTFTANATTQAFVFTNTATSGTVDVLVNALQVRDVTGLSYIPIPAPFWAGFVNGSWDTSTTNWGSGQSFAVLTNFYSFVNFADTNVVGGAVITSNITVQAAGVRVDTINFRNNSVSYTVQNASGTTGIAGSTAINKTMAGTVTLAGINSYSGGTVIGNGGGKLVVTTPLALGTGNIAINKQGTGSGTLVLQTTGVNTFTNSFNGFASATFFSGGGSAQIENASGSNTITSPLRVTVAGGNGLNLQSDAGGFFTVTGTITSALTSRSVSFGGTGNGLASGQISATNNQGFNITKSGTGTWTLSANNTVDRATTIFGGTLQLGNGGTTGDVTNQTIAFNGDGAVLALNRSDAPVFTNPVTLSGTNTLAVTTGRTATLGGVIANTTNATLLINSASLTGTLILTNANTYTNATFLQAGTLRVNTPSTNSGTGSGTLSVNGGTLSGNGRIGGAVTISNSANAKLYPNSGGTLSVGGNVTIGSASVVQFDLSSSASGANDRVVLTNRTLTLTGTPKVTVNRTAGTLDQADYVLFDVGTSGNVSGSFNLAPAWTGTTPTNASHYTVITSGTQVLLHYTNAVAWANAQTVGAVTDVITNGTLVYAYDWANRVQTINTVTFLGAGINTNSVSTNIGMTLFASINTNAFYSSSAPFVNLPSAYTNILVGAVYKDATAPIWATITLSNLVSGHNYAIQAWVNDPRTGGASTRTELITSANGNGVSMAYNSVTGAGGVGQYAVGIFTADGTTQTFIVTNTAASGTQNVQLNALQVRDVTGLNYIPIPAPYWAGYANGNWDDATTNWASGQSFTQIKNFYTNAYFADTNVLGGAVTNKLITVQSSGVSIGKMNFVNNSVNYTVQNAGGTTGITGSTAISKAGSGTVTLTGSNTMSGPITVSAGTLRVNTAAPGSGTGSSTVSVNGGTLSGNGRIGGAVTISNSANAKLYPNSGGTLNIGGNLTIGSASVVQFDLSSSASGTNDQVVLTNQTLTLTSTPQVRVNLTAGSLESTDYVLFNVGASGTISGHFKGVPLWVGTTPTNASQYTVTTIGKQILLHYIATTVAWADAHTVGADSDVITNGTLVYAYDWANRVQTINTVNFLGAGLITATVSTNINTTFGNINTNAFYSASAPFTNLSSAYTNILVGALYSSLTAPSWATLTLGNLINGHSYVIQAWVSDPRSGATTNRNQLITSANGNGVNMTYNSIGGAGGVGQYVVGTFTASGTAQTLIVTNPATSGTQIVQLNALQVRDVTGLNYSPIPAPYWAGYVNGNWDDTTTNWASGLSFTQIESFYTNVYFADTNVLGGAVTNSLITIQTNGVSVGSMNFVNNSVNYTLQNAGGTVGIMDLTDINKAGSGTVTLTASNTMSGTVTISGGTVQLGNGGTMGDVNDQTIAFNGNNTVLALNRSDAPVFNDPIMLSGTNMLAVAAGQTATLAGGIANTTNATLLINDASRTGTLVLASANTYTNATILQAGTLFVSTPAPDSGTGSGAVIVNGGTLSGNGNIGGAVTVSNSANAKLYPNTSGILSIGGNVTVGSASVVEFDLDSSASGANDQVVLANRTLTLTGTPQVTVNQTGGALDQSDYVLFDVGASGTISGSFNPTPVWVGTPPMNPAHYSVITSGKQVLLHYTNSAPQIKVMTIMRTANVNLKISLANVMTNWSDADGDALNLVGVDLVTTNGMGVLTNSVWIFYTNNLVNVADQISYNVSDSLGSVTTGYINIVINPAVSGTNSITSITTGSSNHIAAYAVPGYTYTLQRTTSLSPAVWVDVSTNTAADNGKLDAVDNFSDLGNTPPPSAYYRLKWQP